MHLMLWPLLQPQLLLLQGFLASDRKAALELFDKAEEFFKQCKENVGVDSCWLLPHQDAQQTRAVQMQHQAWSLQAQPYGGA